MKGLRLAIAPFAPDQSGAVAVLFDLNGIVVICDAGGCTGNVCGFDEPRWFQEKSAVFSAGLRDMDAILGRDDLLVKKLKSAADKLDKSFAAVVGTPVPAVIATDYQALCRMAEKKTGMPVIAVDTTGTKLYDDGASKTYLTLLKKFTDTKEELVAGSMEKEAEYEHAVGVYGLIPLDFPEKDIDEKVTDSLHKMGYSNVVCMGRKNGLVDYVHANKVEKNLVMAPSGLQAARWMEKKYGIPYETGCPFVSQVVSEHIFCSEEWNNFLEQTDKKVLVVHQQIFANAIRKQLLEHASVKEVTVASWFLLDQELKEEEDILLKEESQWQELIQKENYDVIIADASLKKAIPFYEGHFIDLPHYAVSGALGCKKKEEAR